MINDINGWEKCSKFSLRENLGSGNQKMHTLDAFSASNTGPRKWRWEKLVLSVIPWKPLNHHKVSINTFCGSIYDVAQGEKKFF